MKIFVVGMPQSGRTTVAKAISKLDGYRYLNAVSWVRSSFRSQLPGETASQYDEEYHIWLINRMKIKPSLFTETVTDAIKAYGYDYTYVIDGIFSPKDFIELFDANKDMVIFLNRNGNPGEYKDYENIGVSVTRDFCFWLSSAGLLEKHKWLEYNFSIPGDDSDKVKSLGHKNSVFIVRSIDRAISHIKEQLLNCQAPQC